MYQCQSFLLTIKLMWFRWVGEFEDTEEGQEFKFKSGKCGCWVRHPPTECKLVKSQMLDFLKKNGKKKGQANMTLENIRDELNSNILPSVANEYGLKMIQGKTLICTETARKYLMNIDCYFKGHTKGIYFERHEDDDVRKHRNTVFLPEIRRALHKSYWWLSMPLAEAMQLLAPAKNGSDGALTIDDFTRADIFRRERTPDSKFKYTQISLGHSEWKRIFPALVKRTCQTNLKP
jgi:hypothetical protein